MKQRGDVVVATEFLELFLKIVVCGEGESPAPVEGRDARGLGAFEAEDLRAGLREGIGEQHTQFSGRKIGDAPDFIDRLETGACGDDDLHGTGAGFREDLRRETSEWSWRASSLRHSGDSPTAAKVTEAATRRLLRSFSR